MKIFVAYRYTGEDINALKIILTKIKDILESRGGNVFCSLFLDEHFESKGFSSQEIYAYCLQKLEEHDIIFFLIKSKDKSTGMKLELEQAVKNNKKIILAIQNNLHFPEFRRAAHQIIRFDGLPNLYDLLSEFKPHL